MVVRHHGSVSGSTSSLRAVSDDLVVVRHHGSVDRDDMDGTVCEREDSVRVDLVVVRHHGSVSGSTRIGVGVSDDLVVVRHYGSVSGSTSSLRAVSG